MGDILLTSGGTYLTGLYFSGQKYYPHIDENDAEDKSSGGKTSAIGAGKYPLTQCPLALSVFDTVYKYLDVYFSGNEPIIPVPISLEELKISVFRKAILSILLEIPYGKTMTYGEVAARAEKILHHRVSARAAGQAVGHNPISIIIPCHRVIGAGGALVGYGGGLERKSALLALEKQAAGHRR